MYRKVDWIKIKAEYITTDKGLRQLAEKYNIPCLLFVADPNKKNGCRKEKSIKIAWLKMWCEKSKNLRLMN